MKKYLVRAVLPDGDQIVTIGRRAGASTWEIAVFPDDGYPAESMEVEENYIEILQCVHLLN